MTLPARLPARSRNRKRLRLRVRHEAASAPARSSARRHRSSVPGRPLRDRHHRLVGTVASRRSSRPSRHVRRRGFPLAWIYAIAHHLTIDTLRRTDRHVALDELPKASRLAPDIGRDLKRIPQSQRLAFELVMLEGLSLEEAAESLARTVGSVELRTQRAGEGIYGVLGDAPERRDAPAAPLSSSRALR